METAWLGRRSRASVATLAVSVVASCGGGAPAPPPLTGAVAITAGQGHACALLADRTARCWGSDLSGQLGDGMPTGENWVAVTPPVTVSGLSGITAFTAGGAHSCAVIADGSAWCWGDNIWGELGIGPTPIMSTTPQSVVGLAGATDIRGAMEFTCALAGGGQVWCWGDPSSGGLGNGVFTGMAAPPAAVSGLAGAVAISVGESHACAIMADQTVQCWGANTTGELGDGTLSVFSTPTPVLGLSGAVSVACGSFHTCALLDDGSVRCWGQNVDAELGNGPPSSDLATMPVPVAGLGGVTTLAAGSTHTCALLDNGTVRCWGNAILGQSGTATPANAFTIDVPTTVAGVAGATSVVAGDNFTCALVTGGSVKCWGENTSGQLGDGSKPNDMNNPVPVTVVEGR